MTCKILPEVFKRTSFFSDSCVNAPDYGAGNMQIWQGFLVSLKSEINKNFNWHRKAVFKAYMKNLYRSSSIRRLTIDLARDILWKKNTYITGGTVSIQTQKLFY
jgi:hypothetical protein